MEMEIMSFHKREQEIHSNEELLIWNKRNSFEQTLTNIRNRKEDTCSIYSWSHSNKHSFSKTFEATCFNNFKSLRYSEEELLTAEHQIAIQKMWVEGAKFPPKILFFPNPQLSYGKKKQTSHTLPHTPQICGRGSSYHADQNCRLDDSMCIYSCLSNNKKLGHTDNRKYILGLSPMQNQRETSMIYMAREVGKIWDVLAENKVALSWLMNSNMIKPEKFDHLYLVYHFTVPSRKL